MDTIIVKLILGQEITDEELNLALYMICDNEHASCNSNCPVYRLNGGSVPDTAHDFQVNRGCDCFKDGKAMAKFVRNKFKKA